MLTNKKTKAVFVMFFVLGIVLLVLNLAISFNYLDLLYLIIIIVCFVYYIRIKHAS